MPDNVTDQPAPTGEDRVNVKGVVWSAAAILAAIAFAAGLAYFLFSRNMEPHGYSGPNAAPEMRIAGPVLESQPTHDRAAFEAEKQKLIASWEWVDRPAGIARIPVEQAMRLLAEQQGQAKPAAKEKR